MGDVDIDIVFIIMLIILLTCLMFVFVFVFGWTDKSERYNVISFEKKCSLCETVPVIHYKVDRGFKEHIVFRCNWLKEYGLCDSVVVDTIK
jgi:hypothetical protein